jgi:hypothetical protein
MPRKLTEQAIRGQVEAIGYDYERLEYLGHESSYVDENGKKINIKIIWKIRVTNEIVNQFFGDFKNGHKLKVTKREYENEIANILKEKGIFEEYGFVVKMGTLIFVHLTRKSDKQQGKITLNHLRSGHFPKEFVRNYWDLDSARKYFSVKQPELSKYIKVIEYFPGTNSPCRSPKVRLKEMATEKQSFGQIEHILNGNIPQSFDLCIHPKNSIPTKLYLCLVSEYSSKFGPFATIGVTTRTTKNRYGTKLLKQIAITEPQLNAFTMEKIILNQVTEALGPPNAGNEAWLYTDEKLNIIKNIFKANT